MNFELDFILQIYFLILICGIKIKIKYCILNIIVVRKKYWIKIPEQNLPFHNKKIFAFLVDKLNIIEFNLE